MLGDLGSIASLLGLAVSVLGLGFALLQLKKLRGETQAARAAAEDTRRAVRRDRAIADVGRLSQRIQTLKELHRTADWRRALDLYPELTRELVSVRGSPGVSTVLSETIQSSVTWLQNMEKDVDSTSQAIDQSRISNFNQQLTEIQNILAELETSLQQEPDGGENG